MAVALKRPSPWTRFVPAVGAAAEVVGLLVGTFESVLPEKNGMRQKTLRLTPLQTWRSSAPAKERMSPGQIRIRQPFANLTSVQLVERVLRAESYNTFNHTEWNNIDTGFTDGNFGQVTSTYDPRVFQFGAKFLF